VRAHRFWHDKRVGRRVRDAAAMFEDVVRQEPQEMGWRERAQTCRIRSASFPFRSNEVTRTSLPPVSGSHVPWRGCALVTAVDWDGRDGRNRRYFLCIGTVWGPF